MDKILQCNVTFNNYREGDFQMRSFKYESFNKLLNDFESDKEINITNNTDSPGILRPANSKIIETTIKDEFHAEYLIKYGKSLVKVRFYLEH